MRSGCGQAATGAEARALAFNAIAQDPRVLKRAARCQAIKWRRRRRISPCRWRVRGAARGHWRAVTLFVQQSIDAWRRSLKAYDRHGDGIARILRTDDGAADAGDPWEIARRNFPSVDDATGRLATRLLHEFGSTLLRRAQSHGIR